MRTLEFFGMLLVAGFITALWTYHTESASAIVSDKVEVNEIVDNQVMLPIEFKSSHWQDKNYLQDHYHSQDGYIQREISCLAENIYFEAATETVDGQIGVGFVTLNRMYSERFPNTICDVVYDAVFSKWHRENTGKMVPLRNRCQFSWYCDGKSDKIRDEAKHEEILRIATYVVVNYNYMEDPTLGAMWYHADYVNPKWSKDYDRTIKIGAHIFYKLRANNEKNESTNFGRQQPIVFLAYR